MQQNIQPIALVVHTDGRIEQMNPVTVGFMLDVAKRLEAYVNELAIYPPTPSAPPEQEQRPAAEEASEPPKAKEKT